MKFERWLAVYGKKNAKTGKAELTDVKLYAKQPPAAANGISVLLSFDLPDALFIKPTISALVHVPSGQDLGVLMADVQGPIEDVLTEHLGLKVELSVADPDP